VDLDSALHALLPNDPRWDYGIGIQERPNGDRVHWVEVHPALEGDVKDVLRKHEWLKAWLSQHAPDLLKMTANVKGYAWVATKHVGFRQGSPKAKQLAIRGVGFPCRTFAIP
jgi:hypothetical protein